MNKLLYSCYTSKGKKDDIAKYHSADFHFIITYSEGT